MFPVPYPPFDIYPLTSAIHHDQWLAACRNLGASAEDLEQFYLQSVAFAQTTPYVTTTLIQLLCTITHERLLRNLPILTPQATLDFAYQEALTALFAPPFSALALTIPAHRPEPD